MAKDERSGAKADQDVEAVASRTAAENESQSQHSNLPWSGCNKGCPCGMIWDASEEVHVASTYSVVDLDKEWYGSSTAVSEEEAIANAAFIVAACNQHASLIAQRDALLAALRAAGGYLRNAHIDLATGAPKATALRTIEGGLRDLAIALAEAQ